MPEQKKPARQKKALSATKHALLEKLSRGNLLSPSESQTIHRRIAQSEAPLSFAQERMWFDHELDPLSARFNVPTIFHITGPLDVGILKQTMDEIAARHEILRTRFQTRDGKPVQVISPLPGPSSIEFSSLDLCSLPLNERDSSLRQLQRAEVLRPFDLGRGPLMRMTVCQVGVEEYKVLLVTHHIIADARSAEILYQEIELFYNKFSSGRSIPVPPLPIQYADYAIWQRENMHEPALQEGLTYWKQQLADAPAFLNLPTDHPRSPIRTFDGASYAFPLEPDMTRKLQSLALEEGASLFMVGIAAFLVLLSHYCREKDIVIGFPMTERKHKETNGLIGIFLNTLALRVRLSGNPTFRAILAQVREATLEAYTYHDVPFERVVQALHLPRYPNTHPLFQVMFVLQDVSAYTMELDGLKVQIERGERTTSNFDLTLHTQIGQGNITCILEYNISLFAKSTIVRMSEHLKTLLEGITANPERPLSYLPLLPSAERQLLLEVWNATERVFPGEKTVHALVEEQVQRTPDRVAVVFRGEELTYRELNARANQFAHYLCRCGIATNAPVGVCLPRSIDQLIAVLGILKAGGAYVPLDPSHPKERLLFMIANTRMSLLVTYSYLQEPFEKTQIGLIALDLESGTIALQERGDPMLPLSCSSLCYITYTSGSTGYPKGVAMPHRALANLIRWQLEDQPVGRADRTLQFSPLIFDLSFKDIFFSWTEGGTLVLVSEEVKYDPDLLLSVMKEEEIGRVLLPFVALRQLAELVQTGEQIHRTLRVVMSGGEQLQCTPELRGWMKRLVGCTLYNGYGPSESHGVALFTLTGDPDTWEDLPPIGYPIANTQLYVLDSSMQPTPIGVPGELYIGGECLSYGYVHAPDLTAERFLPNPFAKEPGSRLYKSGDLCRYRDDGAIEYLGRLDQQVKIRGFRIEPGEIEAVLHRHPYVANAVVMTRGDTRGNRHLVAYVTTQQHNLGRELTPQSLRSYLQTKLPDYMIPAAFVLLESFPLTTSGKLDRQALLLLDATDTNENDSPTARTLTEELLVDVWSEVLGLKKISIHDNFFELGGHSLLATRLISRIRSLFKVDVPLRSLFEKPTIEQFARQIDSALHTQLSIPLVPIKKEGYQSSAPLSFAQQRMWFLDRLAGTSSRYHIPVAFQLRGTLSINTLERAIAEIVERHQIIRTSFSLVESHPRQAAAPTDVVLSRLFTYCDLSGLEPDRQEFESLLRGAIETPFDLERAPLMRILLLRLTIERHVLLVVGHHIVFDGWSKNLLLDELGRLYEAFSSNQPSPLPALPMQYADFARWQRQQLQGTLLETEIAYWRQRLAGAPTLLNLPTNRSRPAMQTFNGATYTFLVPFSLTESLREIGLREGVTLFMTLLAAFQVLLSRYSGQEDIVVGTPIANRRYAETEKLIGCFVNTLALRIDLSGDPTFCALLARVREIALEAYAHQDMPFERIVESLHLPRDLSHPPLVQVMFTLQSVPSAPLKLGNIVGQPLEVGTKTAKFDLTLALEEGVEGITGFFEYNTDLFDKETIVHLSEHFNVLLESIVENPQRRIMDLPLLRQAELSTILSAWNATQSDYPVEATVHGLVEAAVERHPDAVAIVCKDEHLTYRTLNARANQLAHYLSRSGAGQEVPVGVYIERSIDLIIGLLAILKSGGAYVPLDPSSPPERIKYMLDAAKVPILLTRPELRPNVVSYTGVVVCFETDQRAIAHESAENLASTVFSENLCYIIYTSGSTGRPKGVSISHMGMVNLVAWHQQRYGLTSNDRATQIAGLAFDAVGWELWPYLATGASIYLPDRATVADTATLMEWITKICCGIAFLPTPLAEIVLEKPWPKAEALRFLLTGGDKLHRLPASIQPFQVVNHYGVTEATVVATSFTVPLLEGGTADSPIGYPIANTQIYILDPCMRPVPAGVAGEMYIAGVGLARGYYNAPDLSAEKFLPNPFGTEYGARLYKTGDQARYLPSGAIEFLGRLDSQVKVRGFRIELGEIETVLGAHPSVRQAAVLVREHNQGEKRLVAYIVPHDGQTISIIQLRHHLSSQLPHYMLPADFILLDKLPLTVNGKVDRRALALIQQEELRVDAAYVPADTAIERAIADIWREVLGTQRFGIHDNFFDLGGHSLLLIQVHMKLQELFPGKAAVLDLFTYPTVSSLARFLTVGTDDQHLDTAALSRAERRQESRKYYGSRGRVRI